jgi:hypothetical protein
MADKKSKAPKFTVGSAAGRQVERELNRSKNPSETISNWQRTRSLHSMISRAFGTTPAHSKKENDDSEVESLDTDSVLVFLTHLGVSQHEVHKRIGDVFQKQLEDEIRKGKFQEACSLFHIFVADGD